MPFRILLILLIFLSVFTVSGFSQSEGETAGRVLARLSYNSTFMRDSSGSRTCFAVFENGFYRLMREGVETHGDLLGKRSALQGNLSPRQLVRLEAMFRRLTRESAGSDIVLGDSESFTAEFRQDGKMTRITWVNGDGHKPFPPPVSGLVKWLEDFKAEKSHIVTLHEVSDLPLCPSFSTKPAQPEVAGIKL